MYHCKVCSNKEACNFFPSNKSVCKNCISCRNKIKRKTVRSSDHDVKEYCIRSGLNFDLMCQYSENKKIKNISPLTTPVITSNIPEIQQLHEKIVSLENTIVELNNKIKYTEEIMISRTEYSDMGIDEIRRKEEERFQNQELKYNKLLKEMDLFKEFVIQNYYNKDGIISILNQGFISLTQKNNLKI